MSAAPQVDTRMSWLRQAGMGTLGVLLLLLRFLRSRMMLAAVLGPALLAIASRALLEDGQRRLALPEAASALAWGKDAGSPLYVGGRQGAVFAVDGSAITEENVPASRVPRAAVAALSTAPGGRLAVTHINALNPKLRLHSLGPAPDGLIVSTELFVVAAQTASGSTGDQKAQQAILSVDSTTLLIRALQGAGGSAERRIEFTRGIGALAAAAGNEIVIGWADGTLSRFDAASGRASEDAFSTASGGRGIVALAVDAKGGRVAAADSQGAVFIWDRGQQPYRLEMMPGAPPQPLADDGLHLSDDGTVLLVRNRAGGLAVGRLSADAVGRPATLLPLQAWSDAALLPEAEVPRSGLAVRDLQRMLSARGYEVGSLDGISGPRTLNALQQYMRDSGLDTAGKAYASLFGRLRTTAAALDPRGSSVATAGEDGIIRIVPVRIDETPWLGAAFGIAGHGDVVTHLAFSPDGARLASMSLDGRVYVTDVAQARWRSLLPLVTAGGQPTPLLRRPLDEAPAILPLSGDPAPGEKNAAASPASAPRAAGFGIVAGADRTLEAARFEADLLRKTGLGTPRLYLRDGWYRAVALFDSAAERDEALPRLRSLLPAQRGPYPRDMDAWCPDPQPRGDVLVCREPAVPARAIPAKAD
jgi:peptidoglycan hydrolase-like protein with peptidoglycan-binding domain